MDSQSVTARTRNPAAGRDGGEMGVRMRACDWANTSLGAMGAWSHSLRTAVAILIHSRSPMFIWWGPDLTVLYNDACIPLLGARHPAALGDRAASVWADIWDIVGPQADIALRKAVQPGMKTYSCRSEATNPSGGPASPGRTVPWSMTMAQSAVCSVP
jgi:hypothetical protein